MRRSDQRRLAVFALYQHDLTGRELADLFGRDTTAFTRELAEQTLAARGAIDQILRANIAEGWTLERIAPLERNILRVAVNELVNRTDVPREVAIDEAIELAKSYCSVDTPKFVNGILGAILRDLPAPAPEADT
ncbi:MAG: transcription antitermination factor NusB [Solirubrobacterales bacterium]